MKYKIGERKVGEMWKEGGEWKVQFPRGIDGYKTKRRAMLYSDALKREKTEALQTIARLHATLSVAQ